MAGFRYLVFLVLFVTSCAQVGTISGGEKDTTAPQVINNKVEPLNESTNFSGNQVSIPFDEFFRLDNPGENIRIVPPHAKIKAQMKKKTLLLSWDDTLQENTTYAIYINNAVKDISEGNDTIIQYVFSTGATLDSLTYRVQIVDAWTNEPVSKCVVGLFDPQTNSIQNFTETDVNGLASLNYIKAGEYLLFAFVDENRDLEVQAHEQVGFPLDNLLSIDSSYVDSIPIRLFSPLPKPKIRTAQFNNPGMFLIGATRPIENEQIYLNGQMVEKESYKWLKKDSLQIFAPNPDSAVAEIILVSEFIQDTASVRLRSSRTPTPIALTSKVLSNTFAPSQPITFVANDWVQAIDTSLITVRNTKDSSLVHDFTYELLYNELSVHVDKAVFSELAFEFKEGAVTTTHGTSSTQKITVQLEEKRKYGGMSIDLGYYTEPVLLELYINGKADRLIEVPDPSSVIVLEELLPGDYTFKIIRDRNNNGQWDVGNLVERIQPEIIDVYSTVTKVRANWDVEVELIPTH